jgi:hypothetical protein
MCRARLTMVSRRQDYFCGPCHTAVCLDGDTCYVYQIEPDRSFEVATSALLSPELDANAAQSA